MERAQGWAVNPQVIYVGGVSSWNLGLVVHPGATVTVFATGTTQLVALYSDNHTSPTPLANPFTADATNGYWFFYAANGRYDVALTGPLFSWTIADVLLYDPGL